MTQVSEHRLKIRQILTKEFLEQKLYADKLTIKQIASEVGLPYWSVRNRATRLRVGINRPRQKDLSNRKFGMLFVIGKTGEYRNHNIVWLCRCECGEEVKVLAGNLLSGGSCSCGCVRNLTGSQSKMWKGCGELSGRYWAIVKANAASRGFVFDISIEYCWDLFVKQNEKCKLSGVLISFSNNQTASLDRIDSTKGYINGNVQWVHKDVNMLKNNYSEPELLKWCQLIIGHAATKGVLH